QYAAIVILGGYMSVYENLPYLNEQQELIRKAKQYEVPLLGICLGAQLIAQALGGRVYKGRQKEIGWFDVAINNEGLNDIFKGMVNNNIKVFQWHGDTYELPRSATLLASSDLYLLAFRIFHNGHYSAGFVKYSYPVYTLSSKIMSKTLIILIKYIKFKE